MRLINKIIVGVAGILLAAFGVNVFRSVQYLMRSANYRGRRWSVVTR